MSQQTKNIEIMASQEGATIAVTVPVDTDVYTLYEHFDLIAEFLGYLPESINDAYLSIADKLKNKLFEQ